MQIERALGVLEKYQASKYLNNGYGSVTCTALLRHPPRQEQKDATLIQFYLDQLYVPLKRLVEKHPQLSLAIADFDKPTIHFIRLDQFDLASIVSIDIQSTFWEEGRTLSTTIGNETDREYDLDDHTVPLWHLRIGVHDDKPTECSITLAIHHSIGDGSSVAIFWRELYTELNKNTPTSATLSPSSYIIKSNPEKALLPAYEHLEPPKLTTWDKVSLSLTEKIKSYLPQPFKHYWFPVEWAGDFRAVTDKTKARHETEIRAIHVNPSIWQQVCLVSKKHGVTPHAPIMAAIVSAFWELWGTNDTAVETWTPINCRGFCNPPVANDEMGNFVGGYVHTWTSSSPSLSFWEKAKTYHGRLKETKYDGAKAVNYMAELKYPDDFQTWWYDHWNANPMARSGGIECSDLGRFLSDKQQVTNPLLWELEGLWFAQSSQMFTMALNLNCISANGQMFGTVGWQKGALNESKAEQFGPLVIDMLKKNCE
ncbi:hypothetical protein INT45_000044 [Circinella minor]|uniref:Condensation domain-containing protein n=1 Tax=Circinella minor TaxID=1195481 RepID=A0A8H7S0M9_9FUNG|nr:hypothetical protein INT45_000044 [Circinella minor]